MCWRYRLSRRKQLGEEYFDTASEESEWTPPVQHRADPASSRHLAESEGATPGIVFDAVGSDSPLEKALIAEFKAAYGKLPFANLNH
jgi:hypothetical protein